MFNTPQTHSGETNLPPSVNWVSVLQLTQQFKVIYTPSFLDNPFPFQD